MKVIYTKKYVLVKTPYKNLKGFDYVKYDKDFYLTYKEIIKRSFIVLEMRKNDFMPYLNVKYPANYNTFKNMATKVVGKSMLVYKNGNRLNLTKNNLLGDEDNPVVFSSLKKRIKNINDYFLFLKENMK